jgi:hypothetical protein
MRSFNERYLRQKQSELDTYLRLLLRQYPTCIKHPAFRAFFIQHDDEASPPTRTRRASSLSSMERVARGDDAGSRSSFASLPAVASPTGIGGFAQHQRSFSAANAGGRTLSPDSDLSPTQPQRGDGAQGRPQKSPGNIFDRIASASFTVFVSDSGSGDESTSDSYGSAGSSGGSGAEDVEGDGETSTTVVSLDNRWYAPGDWQPSTGEWAINRIVRREVSGFPVCQLN